MSLPRAETTAAWTPRMCHVPDALDVLLWLAPPGVEQSAATLPLLPRT